MAYIEEEITDLSCSLDTLWDRFCKLERQLESQHFEDRILNLEDMARDDAEKFDKLTERVNEIHGMVIHDEPQVQQTTEEFVKVVRCKDCKWYIKDTTDPYFYKGCKNEDGMFRPSGEDYCSKGEKK